MIFEHEKLNFVYVFIIILVSWTNYFLKKNLDFHIILSKNYNNDTKHHEDINLYFNKDEIIINFIKETYLKVFLN